MGRKKIWEQERERARKEQEKRDKAFDKKIGKIGNVLGEFVEGMVEPKIKELFAERGIYLKETYHDVEVEENGMHIAEIDLLLVNDVYSVAVEVKTTLTVKDVNSHLDRIEKLRKNPVKAIVNTQLLGAVAGMKIRKGVDQYAMRKGLFVLKQKGEIMEILNPNNFKPKKWKVGKVT